MSLEGLTGRVYGPVSGHLSHAKAAEYVAATGDDADRWRTAAPPSYAGALLFIVAPLLIADPDVGDHTRVLVHSDQRFMWHGPLKLGTAIEVTGTVSRVRERAGLNFVTFDVDVAAGTGEPLVASTSTFLMGSDPAGEPGPDDGEPAVTEGSVRRIVSNDAPEGRAAVPTMVRAASRLDLVRYAAASGDFNPIHFDHETARAAGLDGIVVHGLLMAAWLSQVAAATRPGDAPLAEMKVRFRNALRPASEATASGSLDQMASGDGSIELVLRREDTDLVTARAVVHA